VRATPGLNASHKSLALDGACRGNASQPLKATGSAPRASLLDWLHRGQLVYTAAFESGTGGCLTPADVQNFLDETFCLGPKTRVDMVVASLPSLEAALSNALDSDRVPIVVDWESVDNLRHLRDAMHIISKSGGHYGVKRLVHGVRSFCDMGSTQQRWLRGVLRQVVVRATPGHDAERKSLTLRGDGSLICTWPLEAGYGGCTSERELMVFLSNQLVQHPTSTHHVPERHHTVPQYLSPAGGDGKETSLVSGVPIDSAEPAPSDRPTELDPAGGATPFSSNVARVAESALQDEFEEISEGVAPSVVDFESAA